MKFVFKQAFNIKWLIVMLSIASCDKKQVAFSDNELKWLAPYSNTDTAIYSSNTGFLDTIIFHSKYTSRSGTSNLSQGFSSYTHKTVSYELTENSYHKFIKIGGYTIKEDLITLGKSADSESAAMEFCFLGLIFSSEYLRNITVSNSKLSKVILSETAAQYRNVNILEGIKQFEFDFAKGVTNFVDINNNRWTRMQ